MRTSKLRASDGGSGAGGNQAVRTSKSFLGSFAAATSGALERMRASRDRQGLTLVHVRAQLEQLQDTFMC